MYSNIKVYQIYLVTSIKVGCTTPIVTLTFDFQSQKDPYSYYGLHFCQVLWRSTQRFISIMFTSLWPYMSIVNFSLWPPKSIGSILFPRQYVWQVWWKSTQRFILYHFQKIISIYVNCDLDLKKLNFKLRKTRVKVCQTRRCWICMTSRQIHSPNGNSMSRMTSEKISENRSSRLTDGRTDDCQTKFYW